ncbi:MAG: VanZ family protein [Deltaproteobacteria bacterium]|nr:VanZ family protein [Deltaproteobacteria bacterium]MBW1939800.1 VanZ family protein [Deltaproteobacteria bacterium]MBW2010184.1 VanZ family protein [Deltaproteobacteria bacterium]MBW2099257.1 VanZ family protein [Deltaproteobacteria bacterium]
MNRIYNFLFYWFPVLIYGLLIFIQSSRPSPANFPHNIAHIDKLLHFFGYALLGVLFARAFKTRSAKNNLKLLMVLSIILSGLYGISDEIHQAFVPFRDGDIMDILADILGSICGVFAYYSVTNKSQKVF